MIDVMDDCPWESGELGRDEEFVRRVPEWKLVACGYGVDFKLVYPIIAGDYDDWVVL